MAWLLDTNILSEGRKPKPEPRVTAFYAAQPLNSLYISRHFHPELSRGFVVRRAWSFVASAAEKALRFDDPVFLRTGSLSRQAS